MAKDDGSDFKDDLREALAGSVEPDPAPDPVETPADTPAEQPLDEQLAELEATRAAQSEKPDDPEPDEDPEPSAGDIIRQARIDKQVQAPDHWAADDKALFNDLPSDAVRERVLGWRKQIETGAQKKFEEAAAARSEVEQLDQLMAPYAEEFKQSGMTRVDAVKRMFAVEQALRTNPAEAFLTLLGGYGRSIAGSEQARTFVQQIAAKLGVDGGAVGKPGQADAKDPVAERIAALEQTVRGYQEAAQAEQTAQLKAVVAKAKSELDAFVNAKGEDGASLYPHFEAVRHEMRALMQAADAAGKPIDLAQAYQRAVWSRDDLRETMLTAQQREQARATADASRKALDRAKAARTPRSSSVPVAADQDAGDEPQRETLRKVYRELGSADRI